MVPSTDDVVPARGRLERVDPRTHEFRVRDDVGNAVDLRHVDTDVIADVIADESVGRWVVARGRATRDAAGRLVALDDARLQAVGDPAAPYLGTPRTSPAAILGSAPGPSPEGAVDLHDDEFTAFLEAARS